MQRRHHHQASQSPGSRSLIATRANLQQRRMYGSKSNLPRSYSTPASESEQSPQNKYVIRSFSSPGQNSDPQISPEEIQQMEQQKFYGSKSEIDSDNEGFEQLDDSLLDIDADIEETFRQFERGSSSVPKRVITTLLPGSGLQKVRIQPIHHKHAHGTSHMTRNAPKERGKGTARFHFRPLIVRIPSQISPTEAAKANLEELQISPPLESEAAVIEKEMTDAEFLLNKGANIAAEESDTDTLSSKNNKCLDLAERGPGRAMTPPRPVHASAFGYDPSRTPSA
ncbi:unnamed protein product [Leptosia nina]|uniref:Uncharacterized protein n=1 Tax=Leptosia nina TaxID=320188 RepID=A0AAV1JBF6_9NEOP